MISLTSVSNWKVLKTVAHIEITSDPQGYTISEGKTNVGFKNIGGKIMYMGDTNTDSTHGWELLPKEGFIFQSADKGFTVYFATVGEDTSTLAILEG